MLRRHLFGLLGLWLFLGAVNASAEPPLPEKIEFNRDVRPILSDFCFQCHGPDQHARQADLRLDTLQGLLGAAEQPGVVRAGKPADSELLKRVTSTDPEEMMPPPKASKRLSSRDIAVLEKWVEQGAEYQGHWAYIPPQKSTPPHDVSPAASRNAIDAFVQARLSMAGLAAAPAADKRTLHRRLSLDLTGLPPRAEDVERFVND
ncbi:MAG: c-type cytochrome domain-containing protein, partial [Planctomycetaceae bacterium]|nr:c-type cytochrome domain-containing protein [Planctomycetaceae bacterium]